MSVSIIDGTLESVTIKRKASRIWRLADVVFRRADGALETMTGTVVVTPAMGELLRPGLTGRFYTFKSIDHGGIHAVKPSGGATTMRFPATNETMMAILVGVNIVVAALTYAIDQQPFWLPIALIPFTGILWFFYRRVRVEAEAQVAA